MLSLPKQIIFAKKKENIVIIRLAAKKDGKNIFVYLLIILNILQSLINIAT